MGNQPSKDHQSAWEQKKSDLGGLNPELTFTNRAGKMLWKACTKHPGHEHFIPVKLFTKDHLPLKYRNDDIFDSIITSSDLTVRIVVGYTSTQRPEGDSSSSMRGKKIGRFGSGFVFKVQCLNIKDFCACQDCEQSSERRPVVARIFVKTANHVVFDTSEAKATVAELFYDDDENQDNVKRLSGSKVIEHNIREDWCVFECLTHDEDLAKRLSATLRKLDKLDKVLETKKFDSSVDLAVVASHPHGCSKQISIGELIMEPPFDIQFDGDKVYFTLDFGRWVTPDVHRWPIVNQKPEEAQPTGIGINVAYPDTTEQESTIWQLGKPVEETKKWLLNTGGIHESPENFMMVIDLPGEEETEMEDSKNIDHYWNDLTQAIKIHFRHRNDNTV